MPECGLLIPRQGPFKDINLNNSKCDQLNRNAVLSITVFPVFSKYGPQNKKAPYVSQEPLDLDVTQFYLRAAAIDCCCGGLVLDWRELNLGAIAL